VFLERQIKHGHSLLNYFLVVDIIGTFLFVPLISNSISFSRPSSFLGWTFVHERKKKYNDLKEKSFIVFILSEI